MDPSRSIAALLCALALPLAGAGLAAAQAPPSPTEAPVAGMGDDVSAPRLVLGGRRVQRLAPHLEAHGTCDELCELDASARVHGVPGVRYLDVVTPGKTAAGGARMHFHVLVSPRAHRLMNDALRDGRRVSVALSVFAYDLAENETLARRWIRVRPPG